MKNKKIGPKRPKKSKKAAIQDFTCEDEDNRPKVDVGNLIKDLDADIDKAMSSSTSTPKNMVAGQTVATVVSSSVSLSTSESSSAIGSTRANDEDKDMSLKRRLRKRPKIMVAFCQLHTCISFVSRREQIDRSDRM